MRVWIIGDQDPGDNGWAVVRVVDSYEKARLYVEGNESRLGGRLFVETDWSGDIETAEAAGWEVE